MTQTTKYRVADLPQNVATPFELRPDAATLKTMAQEQGVNDLRKLRFAGEIRARGKRDWELRAKLGVTVEQTCVVSLDPVVTRIDEPITRILLAELPMPDGEEVEMPEDDNTDLLGPEIDVQDVMLEVLALLIPEFPRKDGATLEESVFTEPGTAPLRDEDVKPFAGLAALKDALKKDS